MAPILGAAGKNYRPIRRRKSGQLAAHQRLEMGTKKASVAMLLIAADACLVSAGWLFLSKRRDGVEEAPEPAHGLCLGLLAHAAQQLGQNGSHDRVVVDDESAATGQRIRLEHLSAVDIDSLAPMDVFFKPVSWYFGFGWRQAAIDGAGNFSAEDHHGVIYLDGGAGYSLPLNDRSQCFVQLGMDVEAGNALDQGWRTGIGPRTGCLVNGMDWRMRIQSDIRWRNAPDGLEHQLRLEVQKDLRAGHALRLQAGLLQADQSTSPKAELGWVHYF